MIGLSPTAAGNLLLYPTLTEPTLASTINYSAGQTRSSNAIVAVTGTGRLNVRCNQPSGTVHFILDVTGYFELGPGDSVRSWSTGARGNAR